MASNTISFDDLIPRSGQSGAVGFGDLIPRQTPPLSSQTPPSKSPVSDAANWYLNGVANAASSGAHQISNALNPSSPENNAIYQQATTSSPFDLSAALRGFLMKSSSLGSALGGANQIASSPAAPLISGAGKALDAVMPSFSPQDRQILAASGVAPYTGEQIVNTALMGLRPGSATPSGIITKTPPVAMADVKNAATNVYNDAAVRGTNIPRQAVNNSIAQAMNDLRTFRPAGGTDAFSILDEMKQANNPVRGENGQFQKTQPITAGDLDQWSGTLGNIANETQLNLQGLPQATPKAAAASMLKNKVDDLLSTHAPGWADADANYAAAKTAQGLDRRSVIADIKASGGDYAAKLSQQAKTILLDPRVTSKFSPEDIAHLKTISQGGNLPQQTLNWLGAKLGSRISHGAGALIGGLLGASHGGAEGAVVGGTVGSIGDALLAKGLMSARNRMASNQVQSLANSVLQNSPYGRGLAPTPVGAPNPFLSGLSLGQLPQMFNFGPRPMFGVMPSAAGQQQ